MNKKSSEKIGVAIALVESGLIVALIAACVIKLITMMF